MPGQFNQNDAPDQYLFTDLGFSSLSLMNQYIMNFISGSHLNLTSVKAGAIWLDHTQINHFDFFIFWKSKRYKFMNTPTKHPTKYPNSAMLAVNSNPFFQSTAKSPQHLWDCQINKIITAKPPVKCTLRKFWFTPDY